MPLTPLHHTAQSFKNRKILIIGDVMLDRFIYGDVQRISPEGPIPILKFEREKYMAGGAGNVAANIIALGGNAHLISICGSDDTAGLLKQTLAEQNITCDLIADDTRPTIEKTRFVSRAQQLLRLDKESNLVISEEIEAHIFHKAENLAAEYDVILLSDYAKGLLTPKLSANLINLAGQLGKPIIVDPKGSNWDAYRHATLITPNTHEAAGIIGYTPKTNDDAENIALSLCKDYDLGALLLTRGPQGMTLAYDNKIKHLATEAQVVADVSGAGDTVVATLSLGLAAGLDIENAVTIANTAAAIVVEKTGTATVSANELEARTQKSIHQYEGELMDHQKLLSRIENWRSRGLIVGMTNGCFDLLHAGHLHNFMEAKKECDRLIVAVNSDASVKRLKGPSRPVQNLEDRARVLAHLREVDAVCAFEQDTPYDLVKLLQPDVLIKGGDYKVEEIAGHDIVLGNGGRVVLIPLLEGFSTTATIAKIAEKE
ncbi:MAG: bifunctional D-glycero-beta-D-manno-heptose-7-phosphate kinase/D-glycero-beta-D-manno-heptose 1-phosphate adenylyltransferase HldE [Alphaproteobacteria bacterium]